MSGAFQEYIAAGGNRHPSAADWDSELLAFGTGNNIAIWNPQSAQNSGVSALLSGHTDVVNSVKLFKHRNSTRQLLVSGAADKTVRIWLGGTAPSDPFTQTTCLNDHTGSVNAVAVLPESGLFVTGAADATVKVWRLSVSQVEASHA